MREGGPNGGEDLGMMMTRMINYCHCGYHCFAVKKFAMLQLRIGVSSAFESKKQVVIAVMIIILFSGDCYHCGQYHKDYHCSYCYVEKQ